MAPLEKDKENSFGYFFDHMMLEESPLFPSINEARANQMELAMEIVAHSMDKGNVWKSLQVMSLPYLLI